MTADFLNDMENSTVADAARSAQLPSHRASDWFQFRRKNPDLGIGRTGEDGSLDDWQTLLRDLGQEGLSAAVAKARSTGRRGDRIWISRVLEALDSGIVEQTPEDRRIAALAAKKSRLDLLVWCITHSSKCYADTLYPWTPKPGAAPTHITTPFGKVARVPMVDPLTPERRGKIEGLATAARKELLAKCGMSDDKRYNAKLYSAVRGSPALIGWLRSQRLIPQ